MTPSTTATDDLRASDAVIQVLLDAGVEMVFGMPGGHTLKLYDALHDHRDRIRAVLVREESLAGIMGEVYGRLTGRPGVVMGQGPFLMSGALLGTLESHLASSPMVLLTDLGPDGAPFSHHAPYQSGTGHYGGWDAKGSFAAVTKETMVAADPAQAVQLTQLAFKHAVAGEGGPVAVLFYGDSLGGTITAETQPRIHPTASYLKATRLVPAPAQVEVAAQALLAAERPVILAGNGVRISQAYAELERLAGLLGAPVVTTASGKGVLAETHPLGLGLIGNFGVPAANVALGEADAVLVVGSKLGATDTANENPELLDPTRQTIVQVDVEPRNASWTVPADHVVIGDAQLTLAAMVDALAGSAPGEDVVAERVAAAEALAERAGGFDGPDIDAGDAPILPQRLIKELQRAIPDDAFVTCDAGENRLFMMRWFQTKAAGTYIQPGASGGMGYAVPAAMAAQIVHPDRKAVAVCGDGGFAMSINGLLSARELDLPITVVVLNNEMLGWVANGQRDRVIASEFDPFDYAAIARAMGCEGVRVEEPGDLPGALAAALDSDAVSVVEVMTSRDVTYRDVDSALAEQLA